MDLERKRKSNLLPEIPYKRNKAPVEKPEFIPSGSSKDVKWKKIKLPDLIDYLPADQQGSEVQSNKDNASGDGTGSCFSNVKFSSVDIGSLLSGSLENFLKNTRLSQITSRKRKMTEDIDLK